MSAYINQQWTIKTS